MQKDYSNFPLSTLILQFQSFHKTLEDKKESGKTLTASEKRSDTEIHNQIRMRVMHLKNISTLEDRKPYLFYHTIYPPNTLVKILGKKINGQVAGYEGEQYAIVALFGELPGQPNITKISIPFNQLQLLYVEL